MAGITRCFVLTKSPIRGPSEFSSKVFWHRVLSPYLKLHDVLSLVFHSTWISNRTFTSLTWHTQKQNVKYSQKNSSCSEWCSVALATNYFQRVSDGVICGMICNWSICFLSVACLFLVPWFSSLNIILLRCTSINEYSLKSYLESEQLKAETETFKKWWCREQNELLSKFRCLDNFSAWDCFLIASREFLYWVFLRGSDNINNLM